MTPKLHLQFQTLIYLLDTHTLFSHLLLTLSLFRTNTVTFLFKHLLSLPLSNLFLFLRSPDQNFGVNLWSNTTSVLIDYSFSLTGSSLCPFFCASFGPSCHHPESGAIFFRFWVFHCVPVGFSVPNLTIFEIKKLISFSYMGIIHTSFLPHPNVVKFS